MFVIAVQIHIAKFSFKSLKILHFEKGQSGTKKSKVAQGISQKWIGLFTAEKERAFERKSFFKLSNSKVDISKTSFISCVLRCTNS